MAVVIGLWSHWSNDPRKPAGRAMYSDGSDVEDTLFFHMQRYLTTGATLEILEYWPDDRCKRMGPNIDDPDYTASDYCNRWNHQLNEEGDD